MTRLPPASPRGLFARIAFWIGRRKLGKVPTPMTVAANHPRVLRGHIDMERAHMAARTVDAEVKMLVCLRAATLVGCPF